MKKIAFFTSFMIMACITLINAQQVITVTDQSGQNTRVYDVIDSAFAKCTNGDFVYLPGGGFDVTKLTVNKSITIIGAGYRSDSARATGITILEGTLTLLNGASNGSISGVYINGDLKFGTSAENQEVTNLNVTRCSINQFQLCYYNSGTNGNSKNINFSECIFRGNWNYGCYAKNVKMDKCIFNGRIFYLSNGAIFTNCLFMFRSSSWPLLNNVSSAILSNNIIVQEKNISYSTSVNGFNNNIFGAGTAATDLPGQILGSNTYNFTLDNIFIGAREGDLYFDESKNYHLKQAAIDAIKGTDGTQVGIYGTANPFKDGAMPLNPHISSKSIAPSTNSEGKLQINITVKAQSN